MSLDPLVLKKLLSDHPEFNALRRFMAEEALKLNTLDGLSGLDPQKLSVEVVARERAKDVLTQMLGGLIDPQTMTGGSNPKDYAVDVDDIDL